MTLEKEPRAGDQSFRATMMLIEVAFDFKYKIP